MAKHKTVETDANIGSSENPGGHAEGAVRAKKERKPRVASMIHAWGEMFQTAAQDGLSREEVINTMKEKFPAKAGTIDKWVDWYKNYYNMGKIKGFENPVKVLWQSEAQAARAAQKEAKKQEREAIKAQKEQARQEKLAAKEQKKAERQAKKEAAAAK